MGFLDFLTITIGVDPGSDSLRITKDGELVFNERAQIAIDPETNKCTALGNSIGLTDHNIIRPINYVIAEFHRFEIMLRGAIKNAKNNKHFLPSAHVMFFSIPSLATEVEKRAYRDSAEHAGAKEVHFVPQSYCSAIGMNILLEKRHFILIDFSASKVEINVFANSTIISQGVFRMGTNKIFRLLKNYFLKNYKIALRDKDIEEILQKLEDNQINEELVIEHVPVKTKEILDALDAYFSLVNEEIFDTLKKVNNHSDLEKIFINGVFFTGGGSAIGLLRKKIHVADRINCCVSQNPLLDNINGLKKVIAEKDKYQKFILS